MKPIKHKQDRYSLLLKNLPDAFAYNRLIVDDDGKPVDYILLDLNPAFEEMTGLKKEEVIGKRVTEILPGIEHAHFDWIGTYGKVALTGETVHFEQYLDLLGRYYRVTAFAEQDHCFSVIFKDITAQKEKEERAKELNCHHKFSLLLRSEVNNINKILAETVKLLPPSLQYPEHACACITFAGQQFKTGNFKSTPNSISFSLDTLGVQTGTIEVCYLETLPQERAVFMQEEKLMLAAIAEHLSRVIEHIRAKEALQESEEKLSITLHSIGDGVIATDATGKITRLNPRAEELTGWTSEEALGRALEEVLHIVNAHTGEPVPNPAHRVINTGSTEGLANDTTLIARDGTRRQIADSAAPIYDCQGKIYGVIMVFSDVTAQYQAREALRKSEERLDAIISNAPAVIYSYKIMNGSMVFTYVNDNVKNVLGFEPQEIMDEPSLWASRIHPEDTGIIKSNVAELKISEPVPLEYRFKHKAGSYCWLYEQQKIITNEEGDTEIVAVCWDITARKQAERLIQARLNLLTFSYNNSIEAVLQKTLDEVCEIVDSPLGFYHFVNDDEQTLTLKAWSTSTLSDFCKTEDKSGMQYSVAEAGVWVDCLRARRPVIHNDYASLPYRRGMPAGHPGVTRELVVPIFRQDKIVALMGVGNKPQDYTQKDLELVSFFADVAWAIVEQKQTEEKIRYISFHDALTGLYNRAFLEEEMQRLDTERQLPISVIMVDLNGLKLVNDTYGHSMGDEMLQSVAEVLKSSCRGEDAIARWGGDEFVILLPQTTEEEARVVSKRIRSKCQGNCVGDVPISLALGVAVKDKANTSLADVLKKAEDNMYKQKLAESRSTRSAVLNALLKTLAAKSFETEEHTLRMQSVAWQIGEKMGLPDSELSRLSLLITLHDIGKINIPEEILIKKGPLTADEWEIMKKHPEIGYRIARATEDFAHVAEDILAHHERWDGKGYPQGLKGDEIPIMARIAAIADAYEVMTNGRPYKMPLSQDEVAAEFKRCAGTQFDPQLVEVFLSLINDL